MRLGSAEPSRPRIAIGCILRGTNSFSRRATGLAEFVSRYLLEGSELSDLAGTNIEIAGFLAAAEEVDAVSANLCDPEMVSPARQFDPGASVEFRLGRRWIPDLTPPISVTATVECLSERRFVCEGPGLTGTEQSLGVSALLSIGGAGESVSSSSVGPSP